MKAPTKKEVIEQLKEEIKLRSLDREHHIRTTEELRAAERRIEELEQLTKGTDTFQVSHPANLFWHRYADHGLRIYTHRDDHDDSKQLLTRIPLFTGYHSVVDEDYWIKEKRKMKILLKMKKLLSEAYECFPDEYIGVEIFMAENNVNC